MGNQLTFYNLLYRCTISLYSTLCCAISLIVLNPLLSPHCVGVHSALQHDVIMNSADPDYVLVEAEASKVAKSAVKAMKASRRHCQNSMRWGRPTWTGSSGVAGAPALR